MDSDIFKKVAQVNEAGQGDNDRNAVYQGWLAKVLLWQMTVTQTSGPRVAISPKHSGKSHSCIFLAESLHFHMHPRLGMRHDSLASRDHGLGGPLKRACGQGRQTLMLLHTNLQSFTERAERQ